MSSDSSMDYCTLGRAYCMEKASNRDLVAKVKALQAEVERLSGWTCSSCGGVFQTAVMGSAKCPTCVKLETLEIMHRHMTELFKNAAEACSWMHDDKSLGLTIGQDILVDGVAALRRQRDALRREVAELKAVPR